MTARPIFMPDSNHERAKVLVRASELKARLDALPTISEHGGAWRRNPAYDPAVEALKSWLIATHHAHVTDKWDGASIKMLGYRASATSGFVSACRNWIEQVRRKAGQVPS